MMGVYDDENFIDTIKKITVLLDNKIKWAFFGGVAVAIHNYAFYRKHDDIDIIIEDNDQKIESLLGLTVDESRRGRKRKSKKINGFKIELLLLTNHNEIVLADGKIKFKTIEIKEFLGSKMPVIDQASLIDSKNRHLSQLPANHKKKNAIKKDLVILNNLKK